MSAAERDAIIAAAEAAADEAEPLTEAEQRFLRRIFAAPVAA